MTTKEEMIAIIKTENPTLQIFSNEKGYVELSGIDYEAQILEWAENRLVKQAKIAERVLAKAQAEAKLAALGLSADDLKALGF